MKIPSVVALGSCYIDINTENYPLTSKGIPVETELVGKDYQVHPGGSAVNFCRLLSTLGLQTAFIGMAGADRMGDLLELLLQEQGIHSSLVRRNDLQTNVSFNMTSDKGAHIMCVAGTANAALGPDDILPKLKTTLKKGTVLYLGGCFKLRALSPAFLAIAELVKKQASIVVVDHGRIPDGVSDDELAAVKSLVRAATYYLPSREEFCRLWNVKNPEEGLRLLSHEAPQLSVVVKDGANGAFYWTGEAIRHAPAIPVPRIAQVTGAGDSFNAGVMFALAHQHSLAEAVRYGCTVASALISNQTIPTLSTL